MRAPQRDQTETRDAIKELETFVERYPNSSLMTEAKSKLREAKDRLERGRLPGRLFLLPQQVVSGRDGPPADAASKDDPEYSHRDAAYFYLGESLMKLRREAEALPYYEKLVSEFEQSEYLAEAQKRIADLKAAQAAKAQG